jgi:putative tricarboxylic transport membrane protein
MRKLIPLPLGQFIMGLVWLGVAVLVFWETVSMSAAEAGGMGPATFPKILAVSLALLVGVYWFQSRKAKAIPFFEAAKMRDVLKTVFLVVLAFTAAFLWESLGALVILLALSLIELRWIEGFGWVKVLAIGLVLSVGTWFVFTVMLGVSLPLGLLLWFY